MNSLRTTDRGLITVVVTLMIVTATAVVIVLALQRDDTRRHYLAVTGWPSTGQAAVQVGSGNVQSSPHESPVPIASVAKMMTAYLVLEKQPLGSGDDGPSFRVTEDDVADTQRRHDNDQSVVAVSAGESLTERQALAAVLLPSANNIAVMLARHVAGSERSFVARMNVTAAALGMQDTTYTDPSGLDPGTRSTAHDQVLLASIAMRNATFADLVSLSVATIPVAGRIYNTDHLLGVEGFVGIKTGSDNAAGGCFVFRTWRVVNGNVESITGVVLGQHGHNLIDAALTAARQFANHIAPTVASAAGKRESP